MTSNGGAAIRGVLFDVGGVLLRTEDLAPRRKWEQKFGLPEWGLAEAVFNSPPSRRASLGVGGPVEIWTHVAERFGLDENEIIEFQRDFWAGDRLDEELLVYIASLRPRYLTAVLSNAWPDMRAYLEQSPPVRAAFDRIFVSAELGMAKPDPRIYRHVLAELGLRPEEAIFVDDLRENVEAAQSVGMAGLVYHAGMDVPAELGRIGLIVA
jgi:putative hydrolase of the HAD superfamily